MQSWSYRIAPVFLAALLAMPAAAAETAQLTVPGHEAEVIDMAALSQLPVTEVASAFRSSKGIETGVYKGVLLWDLLSAKGLVDDPKAAMRHTILVSAGDGHQIAFSVGEIAPEFGARPILLAYEMNGKPIPDGLRMVVPGDMRGARHIKDIVTLDYR
ncbi:molybdopterin-dependent oxidoreductase [Paracoccus laeviglucosivorans]|uniref:Oxidoreductase molybdopterin binding domain-containing protein n=1 Tax=Paracoccus laeviglucosivorans TaxID=1197861 RepID=A0A521AGA1_9RHOB|nr:molybdopterin-dependent oxidoreductase [Paracoccus laeviglucosivorans]SMO33865.1 Oxidoreductase molybdopterin binding domain-containing protein [Paracoccus laeviglucosivorans]